VPLYGQWRLSSTTAPAASTRTTASSDATTPSSTPPNSELLTIGQVAERAGLNTSHIRFYESVGVLPEPQRVGGQRRYGEQVLHRLSIIEVAQRAGMSLEEIAPLTGPGSRSAEASRHIRRLSEEKLPHIEALIARAQAVKHWLEVAQHCDCESADVCGLFVDPTLLPPAGDIDLDVRHVRRP
jgi:MerR family transcriptional regulator, redox-sensitive transcriptional activator SoxR